MWSAFTHEQIDPDLENVARWSFWAIILDRFSEAGVKFDLIDAQLGTLRMHWVNGHAAADGTADLRTPEIT